MKNYPHIIMTGCARTGTTALVKLLSRQKDMFITNEFGTYNQWDNPNSWQGFTKFRDDAKFLKENREIFAYKGMDFDEVRKTIIVNKMTRPQIFEWLNNDYNLIGDKCPLSYLKNIKLFDKKFPNAKFIITQRDGRDVITSQIRNYNKHGWSYAGWMKPTVIEAAPLWMEASKYIIEVLNTVDNKKIFFFKYEDAVDRTEGFCIALSEFLDYDIVNYDNEYKPTHVGDWRKDYPDMMNELSDDFKLMLERFGYVN